MTQADLDTLATRPTVQTHHGEELWLAEIEARNLPQMAW